MNLVDNQLPIDFFRKFFAIKKVKINDKIISQHSLINFLDNLLSLKSLRLEEDFNFDILDQSFYDHLFSYDLNELTIYSNDDLKINYKFFFELKFLKFFFSNQMKADLFNIAIASSIKLDHLLEFDFWYKFEQEILLRIDKRPDIIKIMFCYHNLNFCRTLNDAFFKLKDLQFDQSQENLETSIDDLLNQTDFYVFSKNEYERQIAANHIGKVTYGVDHPCFTRVYDNIHLNPRLSVQRTHQELYELIDYPDSE